MRRRHILIGALALAIVVATIGGVAYVLHTRAQAQTDAKLYPGLHGPAAVVCPGPPYGTIGQGPGQGRRYNADQSLPAIRPRNACTPSFTQQDVRAYLADPEHMRVSLASGLSATGQPTITRVVFLTIRDLGCISSDPRWYSLGHFFEDNFPLDMVVCYAGLSGTFTFSGGLGPPSHLSAAFTTFDAHNGHHLVMGAGAPLG
jgi:hypothetical protein